MLAAVGLVCLVSLSPLLALFLGTVLTADAPLDQLRASAPDLPALLAAGLLVAVHFAALGLLAGSLTGKRVFAVGGMLAVLLVTPLLGGLTFGITGDRDALALDVAQAPLRAAATFLPGRSLEPEPPAGVLAWTVVGVVVLLAVVVLLRVYRERDQA